MNAPLDARCPTCGSLDYRRSHSKRLLDRLMAMRRKMAYRCRHCGRRFYKAEPREANEVEELEEEDE